MVSDDDLIERLESLQGSIDGLRDDTQKRIRSSRRAIAAVSLVALLGVIVGGIGIHQIRDADASRKQRTIAACQQANVTAQNIADASKANFDAFIDLIVAASSNPPPKSYIDVAKHKQHASIQKQADLPTDKGGLTRDCSTAGLNAYYAPKEQP